MRQKFIEKLKGTNLIKDYIDGASTLELGNKYSVSSETVRKFLLLNNIKLRAPKRRQSLREVPPIGKQFGQWTVISSKIKLGSEITPGSKNRNIYWECQCSCGKVAWKQATLVKQGKTLACKSCSKKSFLGQNGTVQTNNVLIHKYLHAKNGITTRRFRGRRPQLTFDLSIEDIIKVYEDQQHKCCFSGISLEPDKTKTLQEQNLSIDRKDSYKGYTLDNIQLVDKRINMMKGSLCDEEFVDLCVKVAKYRRKI